MRYDYNSPDGNYEPDDEIPQADMDAEICDLEEDSKEN
jgi:hypothetical protein